MTITAAGLAKVYHGKSGTVTALDGVDLEIPGGAITAVVGHSGAGKTTLGRCINLLERPSSGTLQIDGVDPERLTGRERAALAQTIGTIFQGSRLLMRRTALQNVMFPLELADVPRPLRRPRAEALLERVGLADKRDAYPRQLSGGQAQRVGIARALALSPRLLISDEATSGLDPAATDAILDLLRQINVDDGLTVLLITHEMDVVRAVADRVALLDAGRLVEQGRVDELLVDPHSRLGAHLLPIRPVTSTDAGQAVFTVAYQRVDVAADWIVTASQRLRAPVAVLAGAIEPIPGGSAGRLTISVPDTAADRVPEVFGQLGLAVQPVPSPPRSHADGDWPEPQVVHAERDVLVA